MSTLITSKSERDNRNLEKMAIVIRFLKQEVYTNLETLKYLLDYKKRQPLDRLLNKMIALGYVQKHVFDFPTGKVSIWGITDLGLAQDIRDSDADFQHFEPYKVKFQTLNHRLLNQWVRIELERQGWEDWHNGDRYSFKQKYEVEHRPDAVIRSPQGHLIAIETERTIKQRSRYRSIFKSHILAKQKKYWGAVFYIVPDDGMKKALERVFDQIEYIQFDESKHSFDSYRNKLVRIFTTDELKRLTVK
ncbi:MobC family replication-relaxation protein [Vibrio coralliilyticus]|uniref:MobC family replication-relaxation protein n=1 Tax=Vibrio coralliilyticus TaxID=190893 RepID=UPI000C171CAA|nr:MobC family replication-relaxation protein [Vibrio coralliilyticus]